MTGLPLNVALTIACTLTLVAAATVGAIAATRHDRRHGGSR